ncbi:MAG: short-subunit dehydrogenase [Cyclobacteriaceae bacterium]|jgi:short-subunit dehydrogenase
MTDTSFKNKYGDWALFTGATSGIEAELTSQIAAKGINIVLVARKEKELEKPLLLYKTGMVLKQNIFRLI